MIVCYAFAKLQRSSEVEDNVKLSDENDTSSSSDPDPDGAQQLQVTGLQQSLRLECLGSRFNMGLDQVCVCPEFVEQFLTIFYRKMFPRKALEVVVMGEIRFNASKLLITWLFPTILQHPYLESNILYTFRVP